MSKQILRTIFFQEIPYTKWLTRGIIVFIPLFLCYCLLPQHSIFRSGDWWRINMEKGNVRLAVYWANCIIRRMPDSDTGYEHRAEAYELGGKYEKALEDYRMAESLTNKYYPSPPYIQMARVYYKKNDTNDAYKYYMKEFSMKDNHRRVKWIVSIICGRDVIGKKLNPYSSYTEFLDFMEKEHEIHGKPEEYEKYMDTLREIKDDMNYIEIEK